jgi:hypothetical protein
LEDFTKNNATLPNYFTNLFRLYSKMTSIPGTSFFKKNWKYVFLALAMSIGVTYFYQKNQATSEDNNENIDIRQVIWLKSIDIQLKAYGDELKIYEDGIVPHINLATAQNELKRLKNADEVVLNNQKVALIIDYPIVKPLNVVLETSKKGFTRGELIRQISEKYDALYREIIQETKTKPLSERKYGLVNTEFLALDLASIEVYTMPSGKKLLTLHWDN